MGDDFYCDEVLSDRITRIFREILNQADPEPFLHQHGEFA